MVASHLRKPLRSSLRHTVSCFHQPCPLSHLQGFLFWSFEKCPNNFILQSDYLPSNLPLPEERLKTNVQCKEVVAIVSLRFTEH